jgi:hypothetical protein
MIMGRRIILAPLEWQQIRRDASVNQRDESTLDE